jgi:aspartyl-tRNA(Asn)/glutamyl-tRNA(Gln) amidotransferase subunit B
MPTLPAETRKHIVSTYHLSPRDADVLMSIDTGADVGFDGESPSRLGAVAYFESVVRGGRDPKVAANWIIHELVGQLSFRGQSFADNPLTPDRLGELVDAVEGHVVTGMCHRFVPGSVGYMRLCRHLGKATIKALD